VTYVVSSPSVLQPESVDCRCVCQRARALIPQSVAAACTTLARRVRSSPPTQDCSIKAVYAPPALSCQLWCVNGAQAVVIARFSNRSPLSGVRASSPLPRRCKRQRRKRLVSQSLNTSLVDAVTSPLPTTTTHEVRIPLHTFSSLSSSFPYPSQASRLSCSGRKALFARVAGVEVPISPHQSRSYAQHCSR
jgi:hypothetical protein